MTADEMDAVLDRARAAVNGLDAEVPSYEELDAAADLAADEQHRLLTLYAELHEQGSRDELAAVEKQYDAAVATAQPLHAAMGRYDAFDGYDPEYDPAVAAAEALEQDRAEEYELHLAEEGLTPEQEYVPELAIE